ncbi:hypothetical protein AJ80_02843 [Polytolypa hystricis UAMH7299]|uniref:Aminoglycoside phosphotransferase domain-containing protein n=1 Tax=Polytolypa hystricis (strain UAMH7299) TaxID=1447883 RepID=A0A2B7YPV7_POLH7|nr:hypothetical protein AJ80_02843 [Polytolypa hystricis UAMH7299]
MQGGFSKDLVMKKENRKDVIVKIPYHNTELSVYTTESEVAVLKYVKQLTNVPVPKVYAWCSDPSNPVGAEYIWRRQQELLFLRYGARCLNLTNYSSSSGSPYLIPRYSSPHMVACVSGLPMGIFPHVNALTPRY